MKRSEIQHETVVNAQQAEEGGGGWVGLCWLLRRVTELRGEERVEKVSTPYQKFLELPLENGVSFI